MKNKNEFFSTTEFYLAALLKALDIKLIKAIKQGNRNTFYFENTGNIEELVTGFYNDSITVSANRFVNSIRDLKALSHNIPYNI